MSSTGKRNALGKGLSALLQDNSREVRNGHRGDSFGRSDPDHSFGDQQVEGQVPAGGSVNLIPIARIETNPYQPRTEFNEEALQELADSIKLHGIIQPLTVRKLNNESYQLISGERRLRASKIAGLQEVPCYVRSADDQEMLEMALVENIQRENLNPLEVAISFQRMIEECKLRQEDLGERVSKSRSSVTNYLRLLKLPPQIQAGLKENKISMGHAKALISVAQPEKQLWLYSQVLRLDLSVRKTEEIARTGLSELREKEPKAIAAGQAGYEYTKMQDTLSSHLGAKVQIKLMGAAGGKIEIPFLSTHDLNRILEIIH